MKMAILGKCLWMVTGILLLHVPAGIIETFLLEKAFKIESTSKPNTPKPTTKPCPSVPHPPPYKWPQGNLDDRKFSDEDPKGVSWEGRMERVRQLFPMWNPVADKDGSTPCKVGVWEAMRSTAALWRNSAEFCWAGEGRSRTGCSLWSMSSVCSVGWQLQGVRQQRAQMDSGADSNMIGAFTPQKGMPDWEGCSDSDLSHINPTSPGTGTNHPCKAVHCSAVPSLRLLPKSLLLKKRVVLSQDPSDNPLDFVWWRFPSYLLVLFL